MSQAMRDQNEDVLCSSDVASQVVDYDSADADSQLLYAESRKRAAGLTGWEEYSSSATRPAAEGRGDGVVPGVLTAAPEPADEQVTCSVAVSALLAATWDRDRAQWRLPVEEARPQNAGSALLSKLESMEAIV